LGREFYSRARPLSRIPAIAPKICAESLKKCRLTNAADRPWA
jgi:hypothetical protein